MRKRTSKILSILLAFALIVSAGDVVRAEDVDEQKPEAQEMTEAEGTEPETEQPVDEPEITVTPAEDEAEVTEPVTEEPKAEEANEDGNAEEAAGSIEEDVQAEQEIEVQSNEEADVSKTIDMNAVKADGRTIYDSKAIACKSKGVIILTVNCTAGGCNFGVYTDATLDTRVSTSSYDSPGYVSAATGSATKCFSIPRAGTYYVGVYTTNSETTCNYNALFYDGSDRALSNGQAIAVGQRDAQVNYFAFRATSTGYLMAQGDEIARHYKVALCNSAKAPLSGDTYLGNAPTYGVKAGVTYYIRVTSRFNNKGTYTFRATNTKISGKFGKTKKKAATIKKKKTMKGFIEAGSAGKKAKWYKFKMGGKKKVNLSVVTGSNDVLKITIYRGGKKITSRNVYGNATGTIRSVGKWPKGTYYIKVQRGNSKSSGYYTLKWK